MLMVLVVAALLVFKQKAAKSLTLALLLVLTQSDVASALKWKFALMMTLILDVLLELSGALKKDLSRWMLMVQETVVLFHNNLELSKLTHSKLQFNIDISYDRTR
ncbi:MAG: hypothetical protein EBS61_09585 [Betaproteobacteria bacterium]|nr:hypothetical protein [Betaproteobacteria bacterium]